MATIFDLRHTQTSDSISTCIAVLPDPENMDIAVGISLLSSIEDEIYVIANVIPVMAVVFDLPLTSMSASVHTSPTELLDPENVGIAFGISLLSNI